MPHCGTLSIDLLTGKNAEAAHFKMFEHDVKKLHFPVTFPAPFGSIPAVTLALTAMHSTTGQVFMAFHFSPVAITTGGFQIELAMTAINNVKSFSVSWFAFETTHSQPAPASSSANSFFGDATGSPFPPV